MKYKVLIFILMLFSLLDCYAFDRNYKYNYEVSSVSFDGKRGTIEGWAILNAGVNDNSNSDTSHGSPDINRNLESTDTNSYKYTLRIYALNVDGNVAKEIKYIEYEESSKTNNVDLTDVMCFKQDGFCVDERSSNYKNVGFKFNFDFDHFKDSRKYTIVGNSKLIINSYKFVLTVKSTAGTCSDSNDESCSETFPLTFLEEAVSTDARVYFDSKTYADEVTFVANQAGLIKDLLDSNNKCRNRIPGNSALNINKAGNNYKLTKSSEEGILKNKASYYCNDRGVRYYHLTISGVSGWVPASWIAPVKGEYTAIKNDVCNVNKNDFIFDGESNDPKVNSCVDEVNLVDKASSSCITQDNTKYYTITCEDRIKVDYKTTKDKYYRDDDFDINVTITSYVECKGTFDHIKWNSKYNNGNNSVKNSLKEIKNNFLNFSLDNYNTNPSGVLKYKDENNKTVNQDLKINNTKSESGEMDIEYSSNKSIPKEFVYQTNKQIIEMSLKDLVKASNIKDDSSYDVIISNLGYANKSKALYKCKIKKILFVFRPVDVNNPFVSNEREVGENWKNDKFDFVNIIDKEIWNDPNKAKYVFYLSKNNIKEIKKNNHDVGVEAFFGSECCVIDNKYYCPFLRDYKYFSKIYFKNIEQDKSLSVKYCK